MTSSEEALQNSVLEFLRKHRHGPSISFAAIQNGVEATGSEIREAVNELASSGRIVITRYDQAAWSYRAVDEPKPREDALQAEPDEDCVICDGTGHGAAGNEYPCSACDGTGMRQEPEEPLPTPDECPARSNHEWYAKQGVECSACEEPEEVLQTCAYRGCQGQCTTFPGGTCSMEHRYLLAGEKAERERIVSWLRYEWPRDLHIADCTPEVSALMEKIADAIEEGEHRG